MQRVTIRQSSDQVAALAYLNRDPHVNRELVLALRYDHITRLDLARRNDAVVGVLVRGPAPFGSEPTWIRLEADDHHAVHKLLDREQLAPRSYVSIHRPWIGEFVAQHYGLQPDGTGILGYLLERNVNRSSANGDALLLTVHDRRLVERSNCGWTVGYFDRILSEGRHPWAIVRDGAIVCRASSGYPHADSEEVIGVWTHPRWRQRGFARQLVSAVVADIHTRARYAVYTTTYDNIASQAIARSLGFVPCYDASGYRVP